MAVFAFTKLLASRELQELLPSAACPGTALTVAEALRDAGNQGRKFPSVAIHVAEVTIVDVRGTAVRLAAWTTVLLFATWAKMMRQNRFLLTSLRLT